ncbi:L-2,4-diaminobutyrate decarboxylase [Aspergillus californicus]
MTEKEEDVDQFHTKVSIATIAALTRLLKLSTQTPSDPIVRTLDAAGTKEMQEAFLPRESPHDVASVIQETIDIFDNHMRLTHPHCFCYVPSCPSPLAWLGDLFTSLYNVNAVSWDVSSGPSAMEQAMIRWLAHQVGLPPSATGCFVSGGSMANLSAVVAARDKLLPPLRRPEGTIYVSDQTHISIKKCLHIIGFHEHQVRVIPTDQAFRMDIAILQRTIAADRQCGRLPFLLVASCGTTNTGSIDPLHALADVAKEEGLWLHVDGAYGASIALSDKHCHLVNGIGRADSISWDGHKWLFQTYGCGIVLTRDSTSLATSFAVDAEYINSTTPHGAVNFYNFGPELSRPARAIPLWFTLRVLGRRKMGEMIDHGFLLARTVEDEIRRYAHWLILAPVTASIVVFQYSPPGLKDNELDDLNLAISSRLLTENVASIFTTKVRGRVALRLCAMNPATRTDTIMEVVQQMDQVASTISTSRPGLYKDCKD